MKICMVLSFETDNKYSQKQYYPLFWKIENKSNTLVISTHLKWHKCTLKYY